MTNKTQPTAHAEITAPISADLRGMPGLSEQDAGLLEQAASMLEGVQNDERNRGNCSTAEGAGCSADAVRRLAVQLLRSTETAQCLHQGAEPDKHMTIGRALREGLRAEPWISGGPGAAACVGLCAIQLQGWWHTAETAKAYADAFNRGADDMRAALQAAPPAPAAVAVPAPIAAGMKAAADLVQEQADLYIAEHAETDPDTGAVIWHHRDYGFDWHNGLEELAQKLLARAALAAAPAQAPKATGTAHLPYFSYDEDAGAQFWATQERAIKECQDAIDAYREDVEDGWPDDVESVRWGVVLGRTVKTDERPDDSCDYSLTPYAAPAQEHATQLAGPVLHDIEAGTEVMAWLRENRAPHSIYSKMSACLFGDPDASRAAPGQPLAAHRRMAAIPVSAAKEIARAYGYDQVVIIARRVGDEPEPHGEHVTTYGANEAHCGTAARVGNFIKHKIMGWPEHEPAAPAQAQEDAHYALTQAARDVLAERARQVAAEGFSHARDDEYVGRQLAGAAAAYLILAAGGREDDARAVWPWRQEWLKPGDQRRYLKKAGALALAEMERLDRAAARAAQGGAA